ALALPVGDGDQHGPVQLVDLRVRDLHVVELLPDERRPVHDIFQQHAEPPSSLASRSGTGSSAIACATALPTVPSGGRTTQLSSRLTRREPLKHNETSFAWPVCCSGLFGQVAPR